LLDNELRMMNQTMTDMPYSKLNYYRRVAYNKSIASSNNENK